MTPPDPTPAETNNQILVISAQMSHPPPRPVPPPPQGQSQGSWGGGGQSPAPTCGHPDNPRVISLGEQCCSRKPLSPPKVSLFQEPLPCGGRGALLSLPSAPDSIPRGSSWTQLHTPSPPTPKTSVLGGGCTTLPQRWQGGQARLYGEAYASKIGAQPPSSPPDLLEPHREEKGTFGAKAAQAHVVRNNMKYYLSPQHMVGATEPEMGRNCLGFFCSGRGFSAFACAPPPPPSIVNASFQTPSPPEAVGPDRGSVPFGTEEAAGEEGAVFPTLPLPPPGSAQKAS